MTARPFELKSQACTTANKLSCKKAFIYTGLTCRRAGTDHHAAVIPNLLWVVHDAILEQHLIDKRQDHLTAVTTGKGSKASGSIPSRMLCVA